MKHRTIITLVLVASLGGWTVARAALPPGRAGAPAPEAALALLAALAPQAPAPSADTLLPQRADSQLRHVWSEQDVLHGVQLEVRQDPRRWIAAFRPLSPNGAAIGYARVRYRTLATSVDYVMTQAGESWVTQVPKPLALLPGTEVSFDCWSTSGDPADLTTALYHQTLEF